MAGPPQTASLYFDAVAALVVAVVVGLNALVGAAAPTDVGGLPIYSDFEVKSWACQVRIIANTFFATTPLTPSSALEHLLKVSLQCENVVARRKGADVHHQPLVVGCFLVMNFFAPFAG